MKLEDLKLLVDVAWWERNGQQGFVVGKGFGAACNRLIKMGLLIENPNSQLPVVTLTERAESLIFDTPPKYSAMQAAALERRVKRLERAAVTNSNGYRLCMHCCAQAHAGQRLSHEPRCPLNKTKEPKK